MNSYLLLAVAVILLASRLPTFMNQLGMPKADKVAFVLIAFSVLGLAWFGMQILASLV
jgi:hypothetical protein